MPPPAVGNTITACLPLALLRHGVKRVEMSIPLSPPTQTTQTACYLRIALGAHCRSRRECAIAIGGGGRDVAEAEQQIPMERIAR